MVHRDFKNAQPGARGFHLHFQIPAVGLFAHAELLQRSAPNRAKWTHVGVTNVVQDRHQPPGNSAGNNLLEIHAPLFAPTARARADHEIILFRDNWIDKLVHELWAITAITVEKNDDLGFRAQPRHSGSARAPISARRFHNASASLASAIGGLIGAAVIDYDDVSGNFCRRDFPNDTGNRFFFVERRNDD